MSPVDRLSCVESLKFELIAVQCEKSDQDRPRPRTICLWTLRWLHLFFHDTSLLTYNIDTKFTSHHIHVSRNPWRLQFSILPPLIFPGILACFDIGTHISIGIRIGITRTIAHLFPYIQISVFLTWPKHWYLHPHHHTYISHHRSSIEHSHLRST